MFTLRDVDEAFLANDSSQLEPVGQFSPELSEKGIGDLCWDLVTNDYRITAAKSGGLKLDNDLPFPPNTLDSMVCWHSGRKKDKAVRFVKVPDMKVQAIWRLGSIGIVAVGSGEARSVKAM